MALRTHLGRHMDLSLLSNRLIIGLTAISGVAAAVLWWLSNDGPGVLWTPVHVFVTWALIRELDPDHPATAIIGALAAGFWVLAGFEIVGALAVGGLAVAARLVSNTTGRRPLLSDLIVVGVGAAAISFTAVGWVAGFGLAIAIYVDDRMTDEQTAHAPVIAALAALGASGVATLSRVFPQQVPDIRPIFVVAIGVLSLIAVVREPEQPTTLVDSRLKTVLDRPRLHASRSLVAVLTFAMAVLSGPDAVVTSVLALSLALVLVSNEAERLRRPG